MVEYKCDRCGKQFKQKSHYECHINRKYKCRVIKTDELQNNQAKPEKCEELNHNESGMNHNESQFIKKNHLKKIGVCIVIKNLQRTQIIVDIYPDTVKLKNKKIKRKKIL